MNRKQRRTAVSRARKLKKAGEPGNFVSQICDFAYQAPLSQNEMDLARDVGCRFCERGVDWYHGGLAGRHEGDTLLPAKLTGADPRGEDDRFLFRKEHVYVTPNLAMARKYAMKAGGVVYRVAPQGEVQVDPTALRRNRLAATNRGLRFSDVIDLIDEFCCPSAVVLAVLE